MKSLFFIICFLISTSLFASDLLQGKIIEIKGKAILSQTGAELKVGDSLKEGDKISTGEKSRLRIILNTEVAIQLGPNSEFELKKEEKGSILIELLRGAVLSQIKPSAKNDNIDKYKVKIRGVVLAVRGTSFFVAQPRENAPLYVCFCHGTINFQMDQINRTLTSKNHDVEYWINAQGKINTKGKEIVEHSEQDLQELSALIAK